MAHMHLGSQQVELARRHLGSQKFIQPEMQINFQKEVNWHSLYTKRQKY